MLIKRGQPLLSCIVPFLALLCFVCSCPALPCPALPCPALPCPAPPHAVPAVLLSATLCYALLSTLCPAVLGSAGLWHWLRPIHAREGKNAASSHALLHIKNAVHMFVCHVTQSHCTTCVWPLYVGERVAYFLGPVPQDKLPKDAAPGNCLAGSLKLGLLQGSKEHAPGAFPIFYRWLPLILSVSGCFCTLAPLACAPLL